MNRILEEYVGKIVQMEIESSPDVYFVYGGFQDHNEEFVTLNPSYVSGDELGRDQVLSSLAQENDGKQSVRRDLVRRIRELNITSKDILDEASER